MDPHNSCLCCSRVNCTFPLSLPEALTGDYNCSKFQSPLFSLPRDNGIDK